MIAYRGFTQKPIEAVFTGGPITYTLPPASWLPKFITDSHGNIYKVVIEFAPDCKTTFSIGKPEKPMAYE